MKTLMMTFFCLLLALIFITPNAWSQDGQGIPPKYFEKINSFGHLTEYQFDSFSEFIRNSSQVTPEMIQMTESSIELQKTALRKRIGELQDLYNKAFLEKNATKDDRKLLVTHESNLSIAIHRQLVLLHEFIKAHKSTSPIQERKLKRLTQSLDSLSIGLIKGQSIKVPAAMGINQVFQASQNLGRSLCTLAAGFCQKKSLSELMDSLQESRFLRTQNYEFIGIDPVKSHLGQHEKAVFIIIGNHDQPLMDIALARKTSLLLGSNHHITMTRKSVYPIPPPESAGDVVFVVDNDPNSNPVQKSIDLLKENIAKKQNGRVSLAVYPEGMLPYSGGQMPMTVKEGAFVIARKLSHQLAAEGIPVYLVQMKTNIIEHLTDLQTTSAKVVIERLEKVPESAIDRQRPDQWIETNRVIAENSFNSHRGKTQIDIFNLDKAPRSKIPYGLEMRTCSRVFIF